MDWNALISVVKGHRIFIQPHNFPDPDAVSSAYGMQVFLHLHGLESTICYDGGVDQFSIRQMMMLLPIQMVPIKELTDVVPEDVVVTVDAQRRNTNLTDIPGREVACIDHHPTIYPAEYDYTDLRRTGSCATLIADYYRASDTPMPAGVATALLYGLKTDTAELTRGVTDLDVEMFSYLYQRADKEILSQLATKTLEMGDLKAYGAAIQDVEIRKHVGFASIPFDCPDPLIGMVADFIMSLQEIRCAVVCSVRPDGIKISVRCEASRLDGGKLISIALKDIGSGGGHAAMAAGFIPKENFSLLGDEVLKEVRDRFMTTFETE